MQNRNPDPDEEFMGNFYTYAQLVSDVTENPEAADIFKGLGSWIKRRAQKYCADMERKQNRKLIAA